MLPTGFKLKLHTNNLEFWTKGFDPQEIVSIVTVVYIKIWKEQHELL